MQKTLTFNLTAPDSQKFYEYFNNIGKVASNSNEYVQWSFKGKDWTALMYKSGKLVVQTSDPDLENQINNQFYSDEKFAPRIGSDEVGKGDYFGPLVVCACYINESSFSKIQKLGIIDSKKITDQKMMEIGKLLIEIVNYEVKIITPREYASLNEKYRNVSIFLAKAHVEVIARLFRRIKNNVDFVVVDQFSKSKKRLENEFHLDVELKQYHRAESDISVAAASIIARYFFLLELESMGEKYEVRFPLGATHVVKFAKNFYKKHGMKGLEDVAKVSFRTTKRVLSVF